MLPFPDLEQWSSKDSLPGSKYISLPREGKCMTEMLPIERIGNILRRKPVDRIGLLEHFWGDTHKLWGRARPHRRGRITG